MNFKYDIYLDPAAGNATNVHSVFRPKGEVFVCDATYHYDIDRPSSFDAWLHTETFEQAQAIAAQFPKSAKVHAARSYGHDAIKGHVSLRIYLAADRTNRGINETGLRRIRQFAKTIAKLGGTLQKTRHALNSSPKTIEEYGWA